MKLTTEFQVHQPRGAGPRGRFPTWPFSTLPFPTSQLVFEPQCEKCHVNFALTVSDRLLMSTEHQRQVHGDLSNGLINDPYPIPNLKMGFGPPRRRNALKILP